MAPPLGTVLPNSLSVFPTLAVPATWTLRNLIWEHRPQELTGVSDHATRTDMSVLGRRTYLRADARKQQILEIAKDVFAKRGVREANVADICEAARIGRGTLYQYFENKNDVLRAVMESIGDRVLAAIADRKSVV